ncbi:unnamed protein product, partial [Mesorhabditis spiculigera]
MSNRVGLTIIACSLGVVFFVACRSALNSLENDEPNVLAGFEYDPNDNRYLEATIGSTCKEVGLSRREALFKNDHGGFGEAAFELFDQYRHYINGKRGGVINAPTSWVEAAAFQHGAASMMSIGYRQVEIQSANNLTFMHPLDICKQQRDTVNSLDFAAAFTTIERSGLGRFNEALDPWGDLRMMAMLLYFAGVSFAIEDVWLGLQVRSMKETGIGLEFCKIPKTGSTIVGNILCDVIREYHGITYAQNISDRLDGEFPCFAHNTFKRFNNGVAKWKLQKKIKFAVVRDPIDRFVSMYGHFCSLLRKCQGRDIHEFAEKVHDALMHRISFVNRDPDIKLHVLPQADFCDLGSNLEQYEVIYWGYLKRREYQRKLSQRCYGI